MVQFLDKKERKKGRKKERKKQWRRWRGTITIPTYFGYSCSVYTVLNSSSANVHTTLVVICLKSEQANTPILSFKNNKHFHSEL